MKGGQAAAEAAAVVSEGGQKISTQYEGAAEANPLNYVLLSVGGMLRQIITEEMGGTLAAAEAAEISFDFRTACQ